MVRWAAWLATAVLVSFNALADGMPIGRDGRFEGGEVVLLRLSVAQQALLMRGRSLRLDAAQRERIRKVHGFAPASLEIFDTRHGENECTCNAYNRGLRFAEEEVEVPRVYLRTDREVREIEKELGLN